MFLNPFNLNLTSINQTVCENKYLRANKGSNLCSYVQIGKVERLFRYLFAWTHLVDSTIDSCAKRSLKTLSVCLEKKRCPYHVLFESALMKDIRQLNQESFKTHLIGLTTIKDSLIKLSGISLNTPPEFYSPKDPESYPEGYAKDDIDQRQKILDDRGIYLRANPPLAKSFDMSLIESNLAKLDDPLISKAYSKIQYFSMKNLSEQLKICVGKLNQKLIKRSNPNFSMGYVFGKSNEWVSNLAVKDLAYLPSSNFALESKSVNTEVIVPMENSTDLGDVEESTLVLFDDNSCSGTQLINHLNFLNKSAIAAKRNYEIFIVIPFLTEKAYNLISKYSRSNLKIQLITSDQRIQQISSVLTEEEIETLQKQQGGYLRIKPEQAWCITDWRRFDSVSQPAALLQPYIFESDKIKQVDIIPNFNRPYGYSEIVKK